MDKNLYYVQCGRSLGEFELIENRKTFIVENGFEQHEFSAFEHVVWNQVKSFESLKKWEVAIQKKVANVPNFSLEKVINSFSRNHLIHPWVFTGLEDTALAGLHVTRNGYSHGKVKEKWLISSTDTKKSYHLSKDQFDVWNAGAGKVMLLEVIDAVMKQRQLSEEEAFLLVTRYGAQLISLSLWNVEYISLEGLEI